MSNTYFGPDRIQRAVCPLCGQPVMVASEPDDTRHRYSDHRDELTGRPCDASGELID